MAAMVAGFNAEAKAPQFMGGLAIQQISPNGKWAASEVYGTVTVINTETGVQEEFIGDEVSSFYTLGLGNCVSDNGLVCVSRTMDGDGAYWEGEWKTIPYGEAKSANAHGITPDGSRICGNLGLSEMTMDDVTMVVPAIWDRQSDGSYGNYTVLPHPSLDLFGRAPQYITALCISDDGKTIVGQIVDCRGFYTYPIIYKQNAGGEWSYSLPAEALFNPTHIEIPETPGEAPVSPEPTSYMSEDKLAEYQAAYQEYQQTWDPDKWPDPLDYMTEEQKAAYNAAKDEYDTAYAEWSTQFDNWNNAYWEAVGASPTFEFNQVALSPDGSKFAMTVTTEEDDPMAWMPVTVNHVWVLNSDGEEILKYEGQKLSVKSWVGDYVTAVETDEMTQAFNGYLLKDGVATSLYDFLCSKGDAIKEWVDLNMSHEVETYDYENDQLVTTTVKATGLPIASRDWKVVSSWTYPSWESEYMTECYFFDFREDAGVESVAADKKAELGFNEDGTLALGEGVVFLSVYDLSGHCLKSVANPGSSVALDGANGVYIVKAVYADGSEAVVKAVK